MKRWEKAWGLLLVVAILVTAAGALDQVALAGPPAGDILDFLPAFVSGKIKPPTNLVAWEIFLRPGQLTVEWQDNSGNEEGFIVERRPTAGGDFTRVAIVPSDTAGYIDLGITPGVSYTYRAKAYRGKKESAYSNEYSATCTTQPPPAAPTNLRANPTSSTSIVLNWQDNSDNEWNFEIHRSTSPDTGWGGINKVNANITTYTDTNLTPGVTYYYKVLARNNPFPTTSDFSNIASATTQQLTNPVLSGPSQATWSFNLIWTFQWPTQHSSNDHYELDFSYSPNSGWQTLAAYPNGDRASPYSQEVLPVAADIGKIGYYRVRALTNGNWRTSNVIEVNVPKIVVSFYPTYDNSIMKMNIDSSYANRVFAQDYLSLGTHYVSTGIVDGINSYLAAFSALRFNGYDIYPLSTFIGGRNIYSATLTLVPYDVPMVGITYSVHACAQEWNPALLTWNNCPNIWSSPYISVLPPANAGVPWNIDVAPIVQKWASGAWPNYGFLLTDPSWGAYLGNNYIFFFRNHSMDTAPTLYYRPRLSLDIR